LTGVARTFTSSIQENVYKMSKSEMSKSARKKAQRTREQLSLIGTIVGVVAIFIVIVLLVLSQLPKQPTAADAQSYKDLDQATTEQGFPIFGKPEAKVILAEFASFSCPYCAQYSSTIDSYIDKYIRTGKARYMYVPMTFRTAPSTLAAYAGLCAHRQNNFLAMADALYNITITHGEDTFTTSLVIDAAKQVGLDVNALQTCINSGEMSQTLQNADDLATQVGISGFPTLVYSLDGGKTFQWFKETNGPNVQGGVPESMVDSVIAQYQ
jgi:protein-disulfide isomerase